MVLNLSIALLLHHVSLSLFSTFRYLIPEIEVPVLCLMIVATELYTTLVILFLMAAEALNVFFKVVLVFRTIDHYALKASVVSWSKLPHILHVIIQYIVDFKLLSL